MLPRNWVIVIIWGDGKAEAFGPMTRNQANDLRDDMEHNTRGATFRVLELQDTEEGNGETPTQ